MAITRRSALAAIGGLAATPLAGIATGARAAFSQQGTAVSESAVGLAMTGRVLPGLEFLDEIVPAIIANHGFAGASLAIAKDGKLKAARGYGLAIVQDQQPMRPTSLLILASVSKVMTAQTILMLAGQGRLSLNDSAYGFFPELRVVPGMQEDPRLTDITVQMLLHHSGGWNRKKSGDPNGWGPRIRRAMGLNGPPTIMQLVRYMKGVPLDFTPGTDTVYSNFGFTLLGAIIMKLTGQPYGTAVQQLMLRPIGVQRMRVDGPPPAYVDGEAHRYAAGGEHPVPGGQQPMMIPAGGWLSDAVEMAWVMTAIDGSRGSPFLPPAMVQAMLSPPPGLPPRANGTYFGMGWDEVAPPRPGTASGGDPLAGYGYGKDGGLAGVSTWVQHLANGVDWAVLINSSEIHGQGPAIGPVKAQLVPRLHSMAAWPDGDLFGEFRGDLS